MLRKAKRANAAVERPPEFLIFRRLATGGPLQPLVGLAGPHLL